MEDVYGDNGFGVSVETPHVLGYPVVELGPQWSKWKVSNRSFQVLSWARLS